MESIIAEWNSTEWFFTCRDLEFRADDTSCWTLTDNFRFSYVHLEICTLGISTFIRTAYTLIHKLKKKTFLALFLKLSFTSWDLRPGVFIFYFSHTSRMRRLQHPPYVNSFRLCRKVNVNSSRPTRVAESIFRQFTWSHGVFSSSKLDLCWHLHWHVASLNGWPGMCQRKSWRNNVWASNF